MQVIERYVVSALIIRVIINNDNKYITRKYNIIMTLYVC